MSKDRFWTGYAYHKYIVQPIENSLRNVRGRANTQQSSPAASADGGGVFFVLLLGFPVAVELFLIATGTFAFFAGGSGPLSKMWTEANLPSLRLPAPIAFVVALAVLIAWKRLHAVRLFLPFFFVFGTTLHIYITLLAENESWFRPTAAQILYDPIGTFRTLLHGKHHVSWGWSTLVLIFSLLGRAILASVALEPQARRRFGSRILSALHSFSFEYLVWFILAAVCFALFRACSSTLSSQH